MKSSRFRNKRRSVEARRYCSNVRLGNWNEEVFLEQHNLIEYLKKSQNGELTMQKIQKLFAIMLREIQIEAPKTHLRFGAIIQLIAPEMPRCLDVPDAEMALSIAVDGNVIQHSQQVSEKCFLTLAPSMRPCVRNTFMIVSTDSQERTNEPLKYGQEFYLQTIEAEQECSPLLVYSSPKTYGLQNVAQCPYEYYKNGEVNQMVGLCLTQDKYFGDNVCLPHIPPLHRRWRCLNRIPYDRVETEGEPIPCNERVVIAHSATNKLLAGEASWCKTFFGKECGVSVTTYLNVQKIETHQNIWLFRTQRPKEIQYDESENE